MTPTREPGRLGTGIAKLSLRAPSRPCFPGWSRGRGVSF